MPDRTLSEEPRTDTRVTERSTAVALVTPRRPPESEPVLHAALVEAVLNAVHGATAAPRSELHLHEVAAITGMGKTVLLGRLRQQLLETGADARDQPIVVALNAGGDTGDVDVASMMVVGQVGHALETQRNRRSHEEVTRDARGAVLKSLPGLTSKFADILLPGFSIVRAAAEIVTTSIDLHEQWKLLQALRSAGQELEQRLAAEGSAVLELPKRLLDDAARDWRTASGERRAPTLVLLVDDADACNPELAEWLSEIVEHAISADGLAMSVVVVSTARRIDGAEPESTDLIARLALAQADGVVSTTWSDKPTDDESFRRLQGWRAEEAMAVADGLMSAQVHVVAERHALVEAYCRNQRVGASGINPQLLEEHVRLMLFQRRIATVDDVFLGSLPGSRHLAASERARRILADPDEAPRAVALAVLGLSGGRALGSVLQATLRRSGIDDTAALELRGLVDVRPCTLFGGDPLVVVTSDVIAGDALRSLEANRHVREPQLRSHYLDALGERLDSALTELPRIVPGNRVGSFLDELRDIGLPPVLESRHRGVSPLAATVLVMARQTTAQRLESLLAMTDDRDATWCQLLAGLMISARSDDAAVLLPAYRALIDTAEAVSLPRFAATAVVEACVAIASDETELRAPALALLDELASESQDAALTLLRCGGVRSLQRIAASHLVAHLGRQVTPQADTRVEVARHLIATGAVDGGRDVLRPVLDQPEAAVLYASTLAEQGSWGDDSVSPVAEQVLATLRGNAARQPEAAVQLCRLDPDLGDEVVRKLLRPHLMASASATVAFLDSPITPSGPDRAAAYSAVHVHHNRLPGRRVATELARLASDLKERKAARVYLESYLDEPLVAAAVLLTGLGPQDDDLLERILDALGGDDVDDDAATRDELIGAFDLLAGEECREQPGILRALDVLADRRAHTRSHRSTAQALTREQLRVTSWVAECFSEWRPGTALDPWIVYLHAGYVLNDPAEVDAVLPIVDAVGRQVELSVAALQRGDAIPDVVFRLCRRAVALRARVRDVLGKESPEHDVALGVLRGADSLLAQATERYPLAAVQRLNAIHDGAGDVTELMASVFREHGDEPVVLAALARSAIRVQQVDAGELFWSRLCAMAQADAPAARAVLDALREARRDRQPGFGDGASDAWMTNLGVLGVDAVLDLAGMDLGLALRAHAMSVAFGLATVGDTFRVLLDHAPTSARATRACFRYLARWPAGQRPDLDDPSAAILRKSAWLAPEAAVAWLATRTDGFVHEDRTLLGALSLSSRKAAALRWQTASSPTERVLSLTHLAQHATRALRSSHARDRTELQRLVESHGLPLALLVNVSVRAPQERERAWLDEAHGSPAVAMWLMSRLSSGATSPELRADAAKELWEETCAAIAADEVGEFLPYLEAAVDREIPVPQSLLRHLVGAVLQPFLRQADDAQKSGAAPTRLDSLWTARGDLWVRWVAGQPAPEANDVGSALRVARDLAAHPDRDTPERLARWAGDCSALLQHAHDELPAGLDERIAEVLAAAGRASLGADQLVARLASAGPDEAKGLWQAHVPEMLNDERLRGRLAAEARRNAASTPLVAALAVLAATAESDDRALSAVVREHVGSAALSAFEMAWLGLASCQLPLDRHERADVRALLERSDEPVALVARALLAPLATRSGELTTTAHLIIRRLQDPASASAVGLLEVELMCRSTHGYGTTRRVSEVFLAAHPDAPGWQRLHSLGLVDGLHEIHGRELSTLTMLDAAETDPRLALALLRDSYGVGLDDVRATLSARLAARFADDVDIAVAVAQGLTLQDPSARRVLNRLAGATHVSVPAALACLTLAGTSRRPVQELNDALRHLTTPALDDAQVLADVVMAVHLPWARLEVTRWLVRLALASHAEPRVRRAVDSLRGALEPLRGVRKSHALVALATTPVTSRNAARALGRTVRADRLTEFDAVAVLAVERVDGRARAQSVARLQQREHDALPAASYARTLALLHPAAVVAAAVLQPRTGQPLRDLVRELAARMDDDDLCTAEVLDILVPKDGLPTHGLEPGSTDRQLRRALDAARLWIRRGSQACCLPAARAAVNCARRTGSRSEQLATGLALREALDGGNQELKLAALAAWKVLDADARPPFDQARLRALDRIRRSARVAVTSTATRYRATDERLALPEWVERPRAAPRTASRSDTPTTTQPTVSPVQTRSDARALHRTPPSARPAATTSQCSARSWRRSVWAAGALVVGALGAGFARSAISLVQNDLSKQGFGSLVAGDGVVSFLVTLLSAASNPLVGGLLLPAFALLVLDLAGRLPRWASRAVPQWCARLLSALLVVPVALVGAVLLINVALVLIIVLAILAFIIVLIAAR